MEGAIYFWVCLGTVVIYGIAIFVVVRLYRTGRLFSFLPLFMGIPVKIEVDRKEMLLNVLMIFVFIVGVILLLYGIKTIDEALGGIKNEKEDEE